MNNEYLLVVSAISGLKISNKQTIDCSLLTTKMETGLFFEEFCVCLILPISTRNWFVFYILLNKYSRINCGIISIHNVYSASSDECVSSTLISINRKDYESVIKIILERQTVMEIKLFIAY